MAWTRIALAPVLALVLVPACNCADAPAGRPDSGGDPVPAECIVDGNCTLGEICVAGVCQDAPPPLPIEDAGEGAEGEGEGEGEPGEDAGPPPIGRLRALPSNPLEFGAVRVGVAV